ncbi:MAG TPA: hypothetical protein ENJ60_04455, partial [Aeromonadales bacterium]|nr:hypothetical protein [Aeromonadales bacterium]
MSNKNLQSIYEQAKQYQLVGDDLNAEVNFLFLFKNNFNNEYILRELVQLYLQTRQFKKAISKLNILVEMHPYDIYHYSNLVNVLLGVGKTGKA